MLLLNVLGLPDICPLILCRVSTLDLWCLRGCCVQLRQAVEMAFRLPPSVSINAGGPDFAAFRVNPRSCSALLRCIGPQLHALRWNEASSMDGPALGALLDEAGGKAGSLTELDVSRSVGIDDHALFKLLRWNCSLARVYLTETRVGDISITRLCELSAGGLQELDISLCSCGDPSLFAIAKYCGSLQKLGVSGVRLTSAALVAVVETSPALEYLDAEGCGEVDAMLLRALGRYCPALHTLDLDRYE
jgi:hypothetical protein